MTDYNQKGEFDIYLCNFRIGYVIPNNNKYVVIINTCEGIKTYMLNGLDDLDEVFHNIATSIKFLPSP